MIYLRTVPGGAGVLRVPVWIAIDPSDNERRPGLLVV